MAPLLPELKSTVTPKIVKMTNIAGVESRPFDPDTYELEEEVVVDVDGTQRMRANDQNVIRWRKVVDADGTARVESNARFVKWSDGSVQLLLVGYITFFCFFSPEWCMAGNFGCRVFCFAFFARIIIGKTRS